MSHDLGGRREWEQLWHDCGQSRPETILVRSWGELGETLEQVRGAIAEAVSLPQFWLDLSESERWFYVREFIQRIELFYQFSAKWELNLVLLI